MANRKGNVTNPLGRPKGVPNKATEAMRNALADFFHRNAGELDSLFQQIKADSPREAFKAVMETAEYVLPKLARNEHTGKDGEPIAFAIPQRKKTADEWLE